MATFTGTSLDEVIMPLTVSDSVTKDGAATPGIDFDVIRAKGGDDQVGSGDGADDVFLGAGDDIYYYGYLYGAGSDTVRGGSGYDTANFKGFGTETHIGGEGGKAYFGNEGDTIELDGVERINQQGRDENDNIEIHDLSGTDVKLVVIDLGASGSADPFDGYQDWVTINGTAGGDDMVVREVNGAVRILGLDAQVRLRGLEKTESDTIELKGGGGADHIDASELPAGRLNLYIDGEGGADLIEGSKDADNLYGGNGLDTVIGGKGGDWIFGGGRVSLDNARDVFTGGGGADFFAIALPSSDEKADIITDMKPGVDTLIFFFDEIAVALDDAASSWGAQHFHVGRNAADGDDFVIHRKSTGAIFFDADGNGDGAKMKIAVVDKGLALAWDDFGFFT